MKRAFVPGLLVLYVLIAASGLFLRSPSDLAQYAWMTGYVLLTFTIAYSALFRSETFLPLTFVVLGILLLNFFVQTTGGVHSFLWPAYFLLATVTAAFLPLVQVLSASGLILAIETCNLLASGSWQSGQAPVYAGFAASLVIVPAVISTILHRSRKEAEQVRDQHARLMEQAAAVAPDTDTIVALTEENQLASNIRAAQSREASFSGMIDMIYEFVPAHTYALFLRERSGDEDVYVLRARRSESSEGYLARLGEALTPDKDNGIMSGCIRHMQPQYLSDMENQPHILAYYVRSMPIKSILAIPIVQNNETIGVLVVDSLEGGAFSLETQDMLARFAPFFIQMIEKTRVSHELNIQATTFAAMHKMSGVLNSTLELGEMLSRFANEIHTLVQYDFCVFVQYDDRTHTVRIAHHSGPVTLVRPEDTLLGKITSGLSGGKDPANAALQEPFPLEEGTLVNQMLNQWGKQQSSPYHFTDLGERTVLGLFDTTTRLVRPLRSLSCWPLVTGEKFIGAFFVGSLRHRGLSDFNRTFLDMLSKQIALVMDNAILHLQISNLARTDGLTGLLNHRTFMEKLREEYGRIGREGGNFSVLLMDIDKFKNVNDTYGHPVGDVAIKQVAKVLRETARTTDFVARYGGEEFAVGMIGSNREGAQQMAERVRSIMEKTVVTRIGSKDLIVTLSIGVASFPEDNGKLADLVTAADNALYQAKKNGRNRVCLQADITAPKQEAAAKT